MSSSPNSRRDLLASWGEDTPSELTLALNERRRCGHPVFDMINYSPQRAGFEFSQTLLTEIMQQATSDSRYYAPDSRGHLSAREAIASYHGNGLSPERILLTPGTGLGYFYAFRLLAGIGDEILCPCPTYPLFDDLARLAGVRVRRYYLQQTGNWRFDTYDLEFQITPRTRAIVLVSPHNPTGMVLNDTELAAIADIARRHNLPLILDEVFREFAHTPSAQMRRPSEFNVPLCVTLNGFSKMFSLPGIKVAWLAIEGIDHALVQQFTNAAAYLSDTFLPVNEAAQVAVAPLLQRGLVCCHAAARLLTQRVHKTAAHLRTTGWRVAIPEAGPYLILNAPDNVLPTAAAEHDHALRLLRHHGIVLHPGTHYGLTPGSLVATATHPLPLPPVPLP